MRDEDKSKKQLLAEMQAMRMVLQRAEETLQMAKGKLEEWERERISFEKSLKASEEQYRSLVEASGAGVASTDREGRFDFVNAALSRMLGYGKEELIGRPFADFLHTDDLPAIMDAFANAFVDPVGRLDLEFRAIRKNGQEIYCFSNPTILYQQGEIVGFNAIIQEITELKRAEEEIRHLASFPQLTPVSIAEFNLKLEVLYINPAMRSTIERLGIKDPSQLIPSKWKHKLSKHPDIIEPEMSIEEIRLAGRVFEVRLIFIPQFQSLRLYTTDVTERKQVEQKLERSRELISSIYEMLPATLCLQAPDYTIHYANRPFKDTFGDPEGRACYEILHGRVEPCGECLPLRVLETGESVVREWVQQGKVFMTHYHPFQDVSGDMLVLEMGIDITERKQAEESLQKTQGLLEETGRMARVGGWELDANTLEQIWTSETYRIHEVGLEFQPTFKNGVSFYAPEAQPVIRALVQRAIEKGKPFDVELRFITAKGNRLWVHAVGRVLQEGGKTVKVHGTFQDITERKQAEERLVDSEKQLHALTARLQSIREEERSSIARELHDELGQALTGLKIDLAWLKRHQQQKKVEEQELWSDKIEDMSGLLDSTIQQVRRLSAHLRPALLDDFGLIPALEWQIQEFQERAGIKCGFSCDLEELDLGPEKSTALYRVFQESMTNVIRHASATRVNIRLKRKGDVLFLEITDNGTGIRERDIEDKASLGILGMRERALVLGGRFKIKGTEGKGTRVTIQVPLDAPPDTGNPDST